LAFGYEFFRWKRLRFAAAIGYDYINYRVNGGSSQWNLHPDGITWSATLTDERGHRDRHSMFLKAGLYF
jgi:hypothetical protein